MSVQPNRHFRDAFASCLVALIGLSAVVCMVAVPCRATPTEDAHRDELMSHKEEALTSADALVALGAFAHAMALFQHESNPAVEDEAVRAFATRAVQPLVRAHAGMVIARRLARSGDTRGAQRDFAAMGFVPQMRVLGPFANTGGASFGTPLPVSDGTAIAATQQSRVSGRDRDVGWQTVPLGAFGEFDLEPRLVAARGSRVLLAAVVRARRAQPAALRLGSSGQIRAVLNGVEVASVDADRVARPDQTVVGIHLVRGDNLLVLEVGFLGDDADVFVRLTDTVGAPLPGITFAVDSGAFERAARTAPSRSRAPSVVDPVSMAWATMADARTADEVSLSAVRAAVALERRLRTGDRRARPVMLEDWMGTLIQRSSVSALKRAEARAWLGDELMARRDLNGARRAWQEALLEDPSCVGALLGLAAQRVDQDDATRARELHLAARTAMPSSDVVIRSVLEFERRQRGSAIDNDSAILARARAAPTEENLALAVDVLQDQGDVPGAIELLQQGRDALRLNQARARLLEARGTDAPWEQRLVLAREALMLRPDSHHLAERFALLLLEGGRREEARAFVESRRAEYPERPEPHALTATLALLAGPKDAAREALRAALALVPQDADLQRTLRTMEGDNDELVARYGLDASTPRAPPPAQAVTLGAHIEASLIAVQFFENGLGRIVSDRIFEVHDAVKAAGLRTFAFPYSPGRERIDVLVAERILADGRREPALRIVEQAPEGKENGAYTDVATKIVVFGNLTNGDRIHVRTRKELVGEQNLFGDFFGLIEPVQTTIPTRSQHIVIEAPLTRPLTWGGHGVPSPQIKEEKGRRIYDFRMDDVVAVEPEPSMPPLLESLKVLSLSTYATWEDLGRWYEALIAPQLQLNDELKRVVLDIVQQAPSEAERVRRIYEYVVSSTRYVGIELGIHGWKPYPVTEVHRRRYGDCKDKASLLVAMLREAGIAANVALVRTASLGLIATEPPSMWMFNHAIAYVPTLDLFLDGTAEQSGWQELPVMDQGALSLIVGAHGVHPTSELRTIPIFPAERNINISDYTLNLGRDGALAVRGEERFRGAHNAEHRREFSDPARWRERLERDLGSMMPGTRVTSVEMSDMSLASEEVGYRFEAMLPERAVRQANGDYVMALSLYPHDLVGNHAQQSTRRTPLFMERPWRTRNVMRYVLPAGMRVVDLPPGGEVTSKHIQFKQVVTATFDGFVVDEDTTVLSRRVPAEEYAEFREAALRADALMKRTIRVASTEASGKGGTP